MLSATPWSHELSLQHSCATAVTVSVSTNHNASPLNMFHFSIMNKPIKIIEGTVAFGCCNALQLADDQTDDHSRQLSLKRVFVVLL